MTLEELNALQFPNAVRTQLVMEALRVRGWIELEFPQEKGSHLTHTQVRLTKAGQAALDEAELALATVPSHLFGEDRHSRDR